MDRAGRRAHPTITSPDLASRVAGRLAQLGMSREELARTAGMSPCYLDQVLAAEPDFDQEGLHRIAAALGVSYREMFEGRRDPPPGQAAAAPRPVLVRLTEPECWDRLGTHGLGRVALPKDPGPPAVFPVNYAVDARSILYRTAPDGPAAPETGQPVTFEIDRMDDALSRGWSVLITGTAVRIDDPETAERLASEHRVEPWAGGYRPLWVRISPDHVSGRHITSL